MPARAFAVAARQIHESIPDPASRVLDDEERLESFRRVPDRSAAHRPLVLRELSDPATDPSPRSSGRDR